MPARRRSPKKRCAWTERWSTPRGLGVFDAGLDLLAQRSLCSSDVDIGRLSDREGTSPELDRSGHFALECDRQIQKERIVMSTSPPAETTMKLTDTKQQFSQVVNRVARGEARVVVEKSGLPVAAIISAEEYRRFKDQERRAAREALREAFTRLSEAFKDVPDDELERELAKAQAEVRAEMRAEREAQREARFDAIDRISDAFADIPVDELERQVERALREVRTQPQSEPTPAAP
jgi:prevent-host-death family protein